MCLFHSDAIVSWVRSCADFTVAVMCLFYSHSDATVSQLTRCVLQSMEGVLIPCSGSRLEDAIKGFRFDFSAYY